MSRAHHRAVLHLIAGFTVWSLGFVMLYSLQALGCAFGWPIHRAVLLAAYAATVLALAILALKPVRAGDEPATSLSRAALWANRAALAAGVLVFLPTTFASTCL